jgi:general stress protein 26
MRIVFLPDALEDLRWFRRYYESVFPEGKPQVGLSFQGAKSLLGKPPLFIAVEGKAELIRDKAAFAEHWTKDLDYWFEQGIDTPNIVLIKVHASRIHYWNGRDEGEILV